MTDLSSPVKRYAMKKPPRNKKKTQAHQLYQQNNVHTLSLSHSSCQPTICIPLITSINHPFTPLPLSIPFHSTTPLQTPK